MSNIEKLSEDKWTALAKSTDPTERKRVSDALKALGFPASEYMSWPPEQRVKTIMEKTGGGADEEKVEKATTKGKNTEGATKADTSGGGGGGLDAATKKRIESIEAAVAAQGVLLSKIHDLLVVVIFSDASAKANAEELGVKVELLGNG